MKRQTLPTILLSIFALVFLPSFAFATTPQNGLTAEVYNDYGYNNAPPMPSVSGRPLVRTTTVTNIDFNWGSGQVLGGPAEDVIVHFTGYIMTDTTTTIDFYAPADDGVKLYLDDTITINDWYDKGGGGSISQPVSFTANTAKKLDLWYYENGGGANVQLQWNLSGTMSVIPTDYLYLTDPTPPPPHLNTPTNLTGSVDSTGAVSLSWSAPESNTVSVERYAVSWSTTNFTTNGWGIASDTTSVTIPYSTFVATGGTHSMYQFRIRADNDSTSTYSDNSTIVELFVPGPAPIIETTTAGNMSVTLTVSMLDSSTANTWFYQVAVSDTNCANPYTGQTLNTNGHPDTFTISGLDNNCLYTIRVANWDSATSLYAVTNVTPVLVFPANSVHGTGDEWGELTLLAPEGKVFSSVVFASYGMPVNYTINSECHADATQLVAAVFIGNETGTVQVTNVDLTGDP